MLLLEFSNSGKIVKDTRLYDLLDVSTSATDKQIRAAWRRAAKKHHPDASGDRKRFDEIRAAFDVLIDPELRAIYDETGRVTTNENVKTEAVEMLSDMLKNVVDSMSEYDIDVVDMISVLMNHLGSVTQQIKKEIADNNDQIRKYENVVKRMHRKSGGSAKLVIARLEDAITMMRAHKHVLARRIKVMDQAKIILRDHEYDRDIPETPPGSISINDIVFRFL